MTKTLLHDTHIHLEMLLEKSGVGGNYRDHVWKPNSQIKDLIQLDKDQKKFIEEALIDHQFVIQSTVSTDNFDLVWRMFNTNSKVFFLLGSHPEIVEEGFDLETYIAEQSKYLKSQNPKKLCGIGEVGLDYFYTKESTLLELQKKLFKSQIELAIELELPLVIHCRDAFDDLIEILNQYPKIWGHFLIHCFTGNQSNVEAILKMHGYIALGGIITYSKTEELSDAVKYCPLSNIMLETDAPYLTPLAYRGNKVCQPKYIVATADKIAEIKNVQTQDILDFSKHNSFELFSEIKTHFGDGELYLSEEKMNE